MVQVGCCSLPRYQKHKKISRFLLILLYCIGFPSLCYDVFLKTTKTSIQLMTKREQVNFVERGIRGGFCFANTRWLDHKNGTILYIDQINLYGKVCLF